jgi:hypothetical protein
MGYSPCFLVKNGQKCMFFASAKMIEINLKGVKMSQNRSKPWAIVMFFFAKSKGLKIINFPVSKKY